MPEGTPARSKKPEVTITRSSAISASRPTKLEAIHPTRHSNVRYENVDPLVMTLKDREGLSSILGLDDLETSIGENLNRCEADQRIVVDDKHASTQLGLL